MNRAQERRVEELFGRAIEQPRAERAAFVARAAGDDSELLAELRALLAARGSASVLSDSVRLFATGLPPSAPALFFQSAWIGGTPVPFGDGLRCTSGQTIRLVTRNANHLGSVDFGQGVSGDPQVHVRGLVSAPGARWYQVWYRNAASFCTPGSVNLTNAVGIHWI